MKRKLLSLALAFVMACSLVVPAAAQSANERLSTVTAQVKRTLGLDTTPYTEFYGTLREEILAPTWELEWNGSAGNLSISATEDGKILSYHVYENHEEPRSGAFAPSFPAGSRDAARGAAMDFMDKVLTANESLVIEDRGTDGLNTTSYRFRGEVLINGLSAGLTYNISVRCKDNKIMSFYRDDLNGAVIGGIPSATPKILPDQAGKALRETLALRLEYVLEQEDGTKAVLRYLPEYGDDYYVDAATGKLVNLTELEQDVTKGEPRASAGSDNATTEDAAPEAGLTDAEQSGAALLEGALTRDELDAKARAITELGLKAYTLSAANYTVPRENDDDDAVTATLCYGRQVNGVSWRRTVVMDAKTGQLLRVSSSAWMPDEAVTRSVNADAAAKTAKAFLDKQCGAQFAKTGLYDSLDAMEQEWQISHTFTFAQKANGYFFPANSIQVGVDATDGSISYYEKQFDDAVTFDTEAGIITAEQALDAWLNTYTVDLQYVSVPTAVDYSKPEYAPLKDYGIGYLYKLVLGYQLERETSFAGIDAKTGKPVEHSWAGEDDGISYSDLADHWAKSKVEALAKYRVGYTGGKFEPNRALTQLDLIALLASTEGYLYDAGQEGAADRLYEVAYEMGLLQRAARKDTAILSRIDTVRMILDAMGYGPVARLNGIFHTKFADQGSIPAADLGYAALAQGLGMVAGEPGGYFHPLANATRAQAATMLYNLMAH